MMMPPTHMIGADDHQRAGHQHQHLHLLDVVGVAGDQRRRAELADLAGGERADPVEDRAPRTSRPKRHRGPGAEVDGGDRCRRSARSGDRQHHAAGATDVAGVALGHAVVDDVGVEAGQVQRGHGADELQQRRRARAACGTGAGTRAGCGSARQVLRVGRSAMRADASTERDDRRRSQRGSAMCGWLPAKAEQPRAAAAPPRGAAAAAVAVRLEDEVEPGRSRAASSPDAAVGPAAARGGSGGCDHPTASSAIITCEPVLQHACIAGGDQPARAAAGPGRAPRQLASPAAGSMALGQRPSAARPCRGRPGRWCPRRCRRPRRSAWW